MLITKKLRYRLKIQSFRYLCSYTKIRIYTKTIKSSFQWDQTISLLDQFHGPFVTRL